MADLTIAGAATLTGATVATNDLVPLLDVSATAGSKGSKITVAELFTGRAISGGTATALTGLAIRSTGAAFDLTLASAEALTAGRVLTFNVGDASRTLTIPATGTAALLGTANVFTALNTTTLGTNSATPVNGRLLQNATAATVGLQSASPTLQLTGQGWKTTATAGSQSVDWRMYVLPVQGAANPTSQLMLGSQVNGGGFTDTFSITPSTISNTGILNFSSFGTVNLSLQGAIAQFQTDIQMYQDTRQLMFGTASDLILRRPAAATLGLGAASATPINQNISGAQGSGSNITAGALNLGTSGTGTGTGGVINFQSHAAGSSGSTLGTLVTYASVIPGATPTFALASGVALKLGIEATTGLVAGAFAALTNATIVFTTPSGNVYRVPAMTP